MADLVYPMFKRALAGGTGGPIDFDADPIYCGLVTSTYTALSDVTKKGHSTRDAISGTTNNNPNSYEVAAGGNYAIGGVQLGTCQVQAESGTDNYLFTAANASWSSATITARGAYLYKRVGADISTPTDDPLIALFDFTTDKTSSGGTFTVQWATSPLTGSILRFS